MKWTRIGLVAMAGCIVLTLALGADAASSLSNSLTGFTGDSTQAGTQAAVGAAGSIFSAPPDLTTTGLPATRETILTIRSL